MGFRMENDIFLRPLELADINDSYCGWYVNKDQHLDYFSGSGKFFDQNSLIKDFNDGLRSSRWFYYLISSADGVPIGNIKIGPIDQLNKTSDMVCLVGDRRFLGKGVATKAISKAIALAFGKYDVRRLQTGMYASNVGSIKAYTRAGWSIEATFKGFYLLNGVSEDRVCVCCLNPHYFNSEESGN
tara:strand:+ start:563 stop:1117 length:555 start_codon:yes stop_codon:yes gene_type:complete